MEADLAATLPISAHLDSNLFEFHNLIEWTVTVWIITQKPEKSQRSFRFMNPYGPVSSQQISTRSSGYHSAFALSIISLLYRKGPALSWFSQAVNGSLPTTCCSKQSKQSTMFPRWQLLLHCKPASSPFIRYRGMSMRSRIYGAYTASPIPLSLSFIIWHQWHRPDWIPRT